MDFEDLKIVSSDYTGQDVASLPDVVSGQATALKARFDNLVKNLVATRFNGLIDEIKAQIVPSGVVKAFAGSTAPDGWLLCNGQAVSRSEYAALFAVIGTTYGAGDGSTTFLLPDMRKRMPIGADAESTYVLGNTGGSVNHSLPLTEDGYAKICMVGGGSVAPNTVYIGSKRISNVSTYHFTSMSAASVTSGGGKDTTFATPLGGTTGSGNTMPPYIALNFIIKT